MNRDRTFQRLVQRYIEGQATARELELLSTRLRDDPEARLWFIEMMNLDSALAAIAVDWTLNAEEDSLLLTTIRSGETLDVAVPPACLKSAATRSTARWVVAAAACALLVVAGVWWRTTRQGFATIHKSAGVVELAEGTLLHGDRHQIQAGTVELITACGARVVIEAPAEFRFESAQRLHLKRGRLSADVPPQAKGFTVVTPTGQAVDLGTKFGVDMPAQGDAEVHVFQGEVIAQSSAGGRRQSVRDGEAFRLQWGAGSSSDFRSAAFIQSEEVTSLHAALEAGQQASSDAALAELQRDPALIALLDFESHPIPQGTYRLVQGRWPGSRAAEFIQVGDHMKLDVGGDCPWSQLTLAAWVRLDRLGEPYQSLLHTDGWSRNNPGQVHWMVTRHTTMRLALFGNTLAADAVELEGFPDSRTSVLPEQGRWVHLAAVYDSQQRTVRFYLNGQFDSETRLAVAHPARLGPAQIGNWNNNDRTLSGRVDELLILGRAMSDEEVHSLFSAGNPYR